MKQRLVSHRIMEALIKLIDADDYLMSFVDD